MEKFVALFDSHFGYERRSGHKVPLHDLKAIRAALRFVEDFKPDHIVLGGDMLDCNAISHHTKNKPGQLEGLRLIADAKELRAELIEPLESIAKGRLIYHVGNHEDWLNDLVDDIPALEGIVDIGSLLGLDMWEVIEQGEASRLGKLIFVHGDTISGGEHVAKNAVIAYEGNVRFGHFHSHQTYTKNTPIENQAPKTGISVPCLCRKGPKYLGGKPNKWSQGFLFGYLLPGGNFHDYVATIINGQTVINGKLYKG